MRLKYVIVDNWRENKYLNWLCMRIVLILKFNNYI